MQESSMLDFSVPNCSLADLITPGFDMPDVIEPDPPILDLMQPDQPDGLDLFWMSSDLLSSNHSIDIVLPQAEVNAPPGELVNDAIELASTSSDRSHLPPHLVYENLETTAGLSYEVEIELVEA